MAEACDIVYRASQTTVSIDSQSTMYSVQQPKPAVATPNAAVNGRDHAAQHKGGHACKRGRQSDSSRWQQCSSSNRDGHKIVRKCPSQVLPDLVEGGATHVNCINDLVHGYTQNWTWRSWQDLKEEE